MRLINQTGESTQVEAQSFGINSPLSFSSLWFNQLIRRVTDLYIDPSVLMLLTISKRLEPFLKADERFDCVSTSASDLTISIFPITVFIKSAQRFPID